jgi:hypothetical protein
MVSAHLSASVGDSFSYSAASVAFFRLRLFQVQTNSYPAHPMDSIFIPHVNIRQPAYVRIPDVGEQMIYTVIDHDYKT